MSKNPNITFEFVKKDKNWDWDILSKKLPQNSSFTIDDVLSLKDKPWNWSYLSNNLNLSFSDIEKHLDLNKPDGKPGLIKKQLIHNPSFIKLVAKQLPHTCFSNIELYNFFYSVQIKLLIWIF